jgi:hypothetical protein
MISITFKPLVRIGVEETQATAQGGRVIEVQAVVGIHKSAERLPPEGSRSWTLRVMAQGPLPGCFLEELAAWLVARKLLKDAHLSLKLL